MRYPSYIEPISYLKSHTAEIVTTLTETREPLLITQNGEATLVVMDVQTYAKRERTIALLQRLAQGRRDIQEARITPAKDVFAHIEAMDKADEE